MSFPLNPDLHCHSTISDGTLTPEELAARAKANGVDLQLLTSALGSSMAGSKVLPTVAKRLIESDHRPLFATDVVKKDISLYASLAEHSGCVSPIGDTVRGLVSTASALGYGSDHYTRIATVLELAGKERAGSKS